MNEFLRLLKDCILFCLPVTLILGVVTGVFDGWLEGVFVFVIGFLLLFVLILLIGLPTRYVLSKLRIKSFWPYLLIGVTLPCVAMLIDGMLNSSEFGVEIEMLLFWSFAGASIAIAFWYFVERKRHLTSQEKTPTARTRILRARS